MGVMDEETQGDLVADFAELQALVRSGLARVQAHQTDLERMRQQYQPQTFEQLQTSASELEKKFQKILAAIDEDAQRVASSGGGSDTTLTEALAHKKALSDLARTVQSELASVLSAGEWQSPSFLHSVFSEAGSKTGAVQVGANDYKRDMYPDERAYAQEFVAAYVDQGPRLVPVAFPTSSCMAAITTVLGHLRLGVKESDRILVGRSTYFQTKWILEHLFPGQVVYIDELDTEGIVAFAREHQPPIVVFDSIGNSGELPMTNVKELIPALARVLSRHATLVLDNTTLGVFAQPLHFLPVGLHMRLIVVESLSKYHQFGFDRANGGILWTPAGLSIQELGHARIHMGTNLPDASLYVLHKPNRALFEKRLLRIGRNAQRLAERLDGVLKSSLGPASHIVYPGLPSHPSYAWAKDLPFCGGFFVIAFRPGKQKFSEYDAFVVRVFAEATRRGVPLIGGTGFGFTTTRVYVPGRTATEKDAFVRVSVGTETAGELEALGDVFIAALSLS